MFATGETVDLAEWIIDDTCLVFFRSEILNNTRCVQGWRTVPKIHNCNFRKKFAVFLTHTIKKCFRFLNIDGKFDRLCLSHDFDSGLIVKSYTNKVCMIHLASPIVLLEVTHSKFSGVNLKEILMFVRTSYVYVEYQGLAKWISIVAQTKHFHY